ncbi:MAG: HAD hydrolase-like protein, partial [Gammaproteobacteria bacterium]
AAPGAHALLERRAACSCQRGILTRSTRANALATLAAAGLDGFFVPADVLGRDDVAPKPAADGILTLLGRWGGARADAIMVGDFRLDLEAGRNAGVATAHVSGDRRQQWPDLTDYRCDTLAELHVLLDA